MQRICVFLASRQPDNAACREAVAAVGQWIGETGRTLIYGGARKGWMELLAQTTKAHGGKVIGVIPQILVERDLVSDLLDVTIHCEGLSDRKAIMLRESDAFVALPGGIGTLDEIFTVLGEDCIGISRKSLILYNVDDCWTPLIETLHQLHQRGLVAEQMFNYIHEVHNLEELAELLEKSPASTD